MQALKRHYEKIVLGALLLGLLALSVHVLSTLRSAQNDVLGGPVPTVDNQVERLTGEDFQALQLLNNADVAWRSPRHTGLFTPDKYVLCLNQECSYWLPVTAEQCPYCGEEQEGKIDGPDPNEDRDGDGISDADEEKYAFLDPDDARDADLDYDGDWFTNLEEIRAGTAPDDQTSHPPVATLLRLVSIAREPFNMMFDNLIIGSANDPVEKWDVVLRVLEEGQWRTRFTKLNGIPVGGYTVTEINRKTDTVFSRELNENVERDVSEIALKNNEGDVVRLVRNRLSFTGITVRLFLHNDPLNIRAGRMYVVTPEEQLVLEDSLGRQSRYSVHVRSANEVILRSLDDTAQEEIIVTRRPPREARRSRRMAPEFDPNMMPPEMMGPGAWPMMPMP